MATHTLVFAALFLTSSGVRGEWWSDLEADWDKAWSDIDQYQHIIEVKACEFVAGKLIDDVNNWVCDEIAGEVTAEAAVLLAGTSLAEVAEDPTVFYVAHKLCDMALGVLENDAGLSANQVCSDLGLRRRRAITNLDSLKNGEPFTLDKNKMMAAFNAFVQAHHLKTRGIVPIAVFPDGTLSHCFADSTTGVYSCGESGSASHLVKLNSATRYVTSTAQQGDSSSSNNNRGLIAVTAVLGVAVFVLAALCVVLYRRQGQAQISSSETTSYDNQHSLSEPLM